MNAEEYVVQKAIDLERDLSYYRSKVAELDKYMDSIEEIILKNLKWSNTTNCMWLESISGTYDKEDMDTLIEIFNICIDDYKPSTKEE